MTVPVVATANVRAEHFRELDTSSAAKTKAAGSKA